MTVEVRATVSLTQRAAHLNGDTFQRRRLGWVPVVLALIAALTFGAAACDDDDISNILEEVDTPDDRGCAAGTYDDDNDPSTPCVFWTDCLPGEIVDMDGTSTEDRECVVCEVGEFSTATNANECKTWTDCPAGQYVTNLASASEDRVCAPCDAGTFSNAPNAPFCTP